MARELRKTVLRKTVLRKTVQHTRASDRTLRFQFLFAPGSLSLTRKHTHTKHSPVTYTHTHTRQVISREERCTINHTPHTNIYCSNHSCITHLCVLHNMSHITNIASHVCMLSHTINHTTCAQYESSWYTLPVLCIAVSRSSAPFSTTLGQRLWCTCGTCRYVHPCMYCVIYI